MNSIITIGAESAKSEEAGDARFGDRGITCEEVLRRFRLPRALEIAGKSDEAVLQRVAHAGENILARFAEALLGGFRDRIEYGLRMLAESGGGREEPGIRRVLEPRLVLLDATRPWISGAAPSTRAAAPAGSLPRFQPAGSAATANTFLLARRLAGFSRRSSV